MTVKIVHHFQISPPLASVPTTCLPLTFFDMPWFLCRPMQRLFFFEFPYSTCYFIHNLLPNLSHSLSLTLQHFFPLSANLICPPPPLQPYFLFKDGDSIPFTVAESLDDFIQVITNNPKDVRVLHPYVPKLPPSRLTSDGTRSVPLLALQVTLFPNSGISIGFEFCHVVADGMAINHFMKSWASLYRSSGDLTCLQNSLPSHYRDAIRDSYKLESIFLSDLHNWASSWDYNMGSSTEEQLADKVRATFVVDHVQVQKIKHWVSNQCLKMNLGKLRISTFVVICAITWVNLIKSQEDEASLDSNDKTCYLGFVADGRQRLEVELPVTYFGNCLAICYASAKRSELVGENGVTVAAKAIANQVKELENGALKRVEKWMSDWKEISEEGRLITISGSPKLRVYDTDFGWGKPKMSEVVQIDVSGAISLSECRDGGGGIEIGLALTRTNMDAFNSLFQQQFKQL
ncbi:coumaroyl-CoA:anthocyanidin 3-O-glucoside-6''-O-coumaroyltransferase 1 [Ricinus communis]|uniref:Anthocyanin 5-aromatic acyltransferase, putative n=1 Tax=Ricinus communis TaxID=3988 RepID=B9RW82_RICCO|nr:coumaroyl-CoA:anthocyanidin 3-O-glucoside-6''-O-coumaroyltransferase 1 [Ricinus communis]EEF44519.1 Anthocyanin 5-aromatic acyltransferase, putative [Ricinus communis]|eukprot:XP_002518001.1 coumaroyl-CoA:anthocyanidin 3-O-glucoside-6''-O-coumaroyltransferase 1 [Ricinus communis]